MIKTYLAKLKNNPKIKALLANQWLWFIGLWFFGLGCALAVSYPIRLLIKNLA
jgi:hypothetical protein